MAVPRSRKLDEVERTRALMHDEAIAQRDRALDCLGLLVKQLRRVGGYMTPTDQAALRGAQALLVESGRAL